MPLETFAGILDKIEADYGADGRIFVDLYNWGEPTLHRSLGEIVWMLKSRGFGAGLSSNLNVFPNASAVIAAEPDCIRVSLSGFDNATYQRTHAKGDIRHVLDNLRTLRDLVDTHGVRTVVQVGFHIYRSNFPADFMKMRALCDELGFLFDPVLAVVMPAETAVACADGRPPPEVREVHDNLVIPMDRLAEIYRDDGVAVPDCQYRRSRSTINFDGSVMLCCAVFDPDKTIAERFVDMSRSQLESLRYQQTFCQTCMSRNMHLVYTGVPAPGIDEEAVRVLGPTYAAFLRQNAEIGAEDTVYLEDRFVSVEDVYRRGLDALSLGDAGLGEADTCFAALVDGAPEFGEGFFQAARTAERRGDMDRARTLMREAVRLAADHTGYKEELARIIG